jgi:N-acetylmuramoyl-L-alanine amidase-like protein
VTHLVWLADVLRSAGLPVVETVGWQTRGKAGMRPRIVICHHTASFPTTPDPVVTKLLIEGRSDLPGPLCHLGLNRNGVYIIIAAGKANHAGIGQWIDANESVETIGIEAYNWGNSVPFPSREPWPTVQLDAYQKGVAALLAHIGRDERYVCAHREWAIPAGRKPDPSGIDMAAFRVKVGQYLQEEQMTITQARIELASAWHQVSGEWMTAVSGETAQQRLTRLAREVVDRTRTVADIVAFAPTKPGPSPASEQVPAWVVDSTIPA